MGVGWCFCEKLLYLQIMEAKGATPVGCLTIGKCFRIVGCCWLRSMFRNISKTFDGLLVLMTGQLCMPIENQVCPKGGRNEKRTQLYKESTLLASRSHSSYTLLSRYMLYWATKVFCTICETMYRRNLKTHISKVHPGAEESSSSGQLVALPPPVTCFIALLSHKNHIFSHQGRAPLWKVSDHPIPYIQTAHKCLICPELTHSITFDTLFPNTRWVEESVKLNQLGDLISWKIISWKIWSAKKLSA